MTHAQLTSGICSVTLRALCIDDVVRNAATAGLAGIEWGSDVHVHDRESAAYARTVTEAAGLRVLSLGSYYRAGTFGDFAEVLALAREVGAPRIRIWAGECGSAEAAGDQWDAVVKDTQRIAELAAAENVDLAFEYHGGTLTDSPETTLELIRRIGRDAVGTYWQPAVGLDDDRSLESLSQIIDHVVGVHCFSWWPATERLPLSARDRMWQQVMRLLQSNGRNLDVMLEFVADDLPQNVIVDAAVLRGMSGS